MRWASDHQIEAEDLRRDLRTYVRAAWPVLEPGTTFVPNWHIDAICERLEAISRGDLQKLIINVPPRHMKSLAVTVFWPMWEWLSRPETRWLVASYAQSLSTRDSLKCRRLIQLPGFETRGLVRQNARSSSASDTSASSACSLRCGARSPGR